MRPWREAEMTPGIVSQSGKHDALREGIRLGLAVATSTWIWIAIIDAIAGEPFHTFTVLGGIASFTMMHALLNIAYGAVIVAAIHSAMRQPSLIGVVALGFIVVEFAFVMATLLLSHLGLGALAWVRVFGGSVIGAAVAYAILSRRHPLAALLREGEDEEFTSGENPLS
jgi:hypothetical protein